MKLVLYILSLILCLILAACSSTIDKIKNIGELPKIDKVSPPVAFAKDNVLADSTPKTANSLWQASSQNFFTNQKNRSIGDIITVKVSVSDNAKLKNSTDTDRKDVETLGPPILYGIQNKLNEYMEYPEPDSTGAVSQDLIGLDGKNNHNAVGKIDRSEDINITVAAMIVQILPNGNFIIEGTQQIRINYEVRELYVAGVVRPDDIDSKNQISSEQIAESRISYGGEGVLSDMQKSRYGYQLLDILSPF